MNQETKACIEELKRIVMALYRSAGNLDSVIAYIEAGLYSKSENVTKVPDLMYVAQQMDYRMNHKGFAFGNLDKRELDAWNRLIEALNKDK